MPRIAFAALLLLLLFCLPGSAAAQNPETAATSSADTPGERSFSRFAATLPPGWDGEERTGFSSGAPEEYMLVLGVQDEAAERFLAQVSVFVLPNRKGSTARDFARGMAELQGDATEPREEGRFWIFEGEPRTQALRGRATTRVAATPERLLILITQDPENLGGAQVTESLRGLDNETRALLGR
ncbi:MAG: protoporphyrinogen oxidase [Desulfovibrio sp.]|uniref:protoporphyrinogen oxidase n=1 Tax=Desulfovibrio sp. TaxID=885 RepID=UPI001A6842C6|nr:protoporphyrinogen oxidase [Desulfovibrio sp.]MBD5417020.1 protoporphyrinogen oxidase [Desulfovibrio sp.]